MTAILCSIGCAVIGYVIGVMQHGINITINHKEPEQKPKEYNQSLSHLLPTEVQQYYQSTHGHNQF